MKNLLRRAQLLPSYVKHYATISATTDAHRVKLTYDEFINKRQDEAKRSIAVQVSSEKSFPELCNYCSTFGSLVNAQHYCVRHDDEQHYILLEYANAAEASAAIDAAAYNEELTGVPVRSPFLWFRAAGKRNATLKQSTQVINTKSGSSTLSTIDGTNTLENGELQALLCSAAHIDEQIQLLHKHTHLNDLGVRMRFLAAMQVEHAVVGMFPAANAQPFGSSVNGFGKMGCDLDLILRFDREPVDVASGDKLATLAAQRRRNGSRLVYHTKENLSNGRSQTQRQMECIGDMLHLFLPGVCHVRRILQARVPIIKYHHEHLDLEVDLSMSNLTGFYMSELLYMFGELDERVRPLTFSVRRWANACGLTNPSPGRWITNFSLTCLVMYFLQQLKQPLLPSISALVKSADTQDIRITEDGINCTFGRDYKRIGFHSANTSRVSELLLQFYEFYSQFDFHNRAVSLNEARALAKPDHSAMYIVNPFEQVLNVSKNVSLEECERFRIEVRNAAWLLESEVENNGLSEQEKLETPWGLLNLFKHPEKAIIRPNMFFKPRMVEVSDLFEKSNNATATSTNTTTTTTATTAATTTTTNSPQSFKNSSVRQQVQNIKATVRQEVKQLRINAGLNTTPTTSNTTTLKENIVKSRRNR